MERPPWVNHFQLDKNSQQKSAPTKEEEERKKSFDLID